MSEQPGSPWFDGAEAFEEYNNEMMRYRRALQMVLEWHEAGESPMEFIQVMTTVKWALGDHSR